MSGSRTGRGWARAPFTIWISQLRTVGFTVTIRVHLAKLSWPLVTRLLEILFNTDRCCSYFIQLFIGVIFKNLATRATVSIVMSRHCILCRHVWDLLVHSPGHRGPNTWRQGQHLSGVIGVRIHPCRKVTGGCHSSRCQGVSAIKGGKSTFNTVRPL